MKPEQRRLLLLSSLGGILEFYDFVIYALFASYISSAFFPASNQIASLLITFATFAIGYLVRPLGGIVFGHYGDRIGRKATFTFSILMMALATLGIGLIPTYATIGITASILVISLRIMQGFSIGGEIPGAITYVSETLQYNKGIACGVIFCALLLGIVLGSIVQAIFTTVLTDAQMHDYGWRIPFILGGIFGLFSYFLRKELLESRQFLAMEKEVETFPIVAVFKQQFLSVAAAALVVALCAAIVTSLFLFTPAYFSEVLHLPPQAYIWQRTLAIATGSLLSVFFGYLTDLMSVKKLALILAIATFLLAYPIFAIYAYYPHLYYLGFIASALLLGFSTGTIPRWLSELFPTKIRYSSIAVSYNLGFAIFGGLTPFICLSLFYYTQWPAAPAFYLITVAILAFISLIFLRKRKTEV